MCMRFDRRAPGGGVEVRCRIENGKAFLEWEFYFLPDGGTVPASGGQGLVRVCLTDGQGNVVLEGRKALGEEEPLEAVLLQPRLWRAEKDPYLYGMEAELTDGSGRCTDRMRRQLPLRSIRQTGSGAAGERIGQTCAGASGERIKQTCAGAAGERIKQTCAGAAGERIGQTCADGTGEIFLNGEAFAPKAVRYALPAQGPEAVRQRVMMEDIRQMLQLGANCVCVRAEEEAGSLFWQFLELSDRCGILALWEGGKGGGKAFLKEPGGLWMCGGGRVRLHCGEGMPDFRGQENSLFLPDSQCPTSMYYRYRARWSETPFIHLAPESVERLPSGNYTVRCYSNCGRVALYSDGCLFEFQRGEGEYVFREIPAKSPCIMLAAEGDGCAASLSVQKVLVGITALS